MSIKTKATLFIIVGLFFVGCTPYWNPKRCQSTNWSQLGYSDGSAGKQNSSGSYSAACSKAGANINIGGYNQGYKEGINRFCSYDAGKGAGVSNSTLHPVCQRFDKYMKGYEAGLKVFCSSENGYAAALAGEKAVSKCMGYKGYSSAFRRGERDFCSKKNGFNLGKSGKPFPEKCEREDRSFERSYNKGRIAHLEEVLKETEGDLSIERQAYERLRDQLQDLQYDLGRIPRYTNDPYLIEQRAQIERNIEEVRNLRDRKRDDVERMDHDVREIRNEMSSLRRRI